MTVFYKNMLKNIQVIKDRIPQDCFTDVELLLVFPNAPAKRYGRIKRAIASHGLIPLRRGLYCLEQKFCHKNLHLFNIAQRIYALSFISLESALFFQGCIPEASFAVTSATIKRSKEFMTPLGQFVYHHLPEKNFLTQVRLHLHEEHDTFFMATPLRSICDYIYVYKKDWKGIKPLKESLRIEEENFSNISEEDIDELHDYYKSRRLNRFLKELRKDLHL